MRINCFLYHRFVIPAPLDILNIFQIKQVLEKLKFAMKGFKSSRERHEIIKVNSP
jgi:hypothetical protein